MPGPAAGAGVAPVAGRTLLGSGVVILAALLATASSAAAQVGGVPDTSLPGATELGELRDATSRTWVRPDGAMVTRVYEQPVNFRDASGTWRPIDNRLHASSRSGYGWQTAAGRLRALFPRRLGDAPVRLEAGGQAIAFGLRGANVVGSFEGARASYAGVAPGVTARWTGVGEAVKEELVLADARVPRSYLFDMTASAGLSLRPDRVGGLEVIDGSGEVVFELPAPYAVDAAGAEAPTGAVSLESERSGDGWVLRLTVSDRWLGAPSRRFPVVVDPTAKTNFGTTDCYLDGEFPSQSTCSQTRLWAGRTSQGTAHDHRSVLRFSVDTAINPGSIAEQAHVGVHLNSRESGSVPKALRLHRVTSAWDANVSWQNRTAGAAWSSPGGDFASTVEDTVTADAGNTWQRWNVTGLVRDWAAGRVANDGVMIKDDGSQTSGGVPPLRWTR